MALLLVGLSNAVQAVAQSAPAQFSSDSANVVVVTIDGLRWEEIFNGANAGLMGRAPDPKELRRRYDRPTAEARRQALFPFLWDSIGRYGQVFGNRTLGNYQDVTNRHRLSYPGYNELLTGAADDERVRANRNVYNPNETVLEFANRQPGLAGRVAVFASWEAFPFILNQPRSGLFVDVGDIHERPDSVTYHAARRYLAQAHPRVLYLAFGNTDTYAHFGRYRDYLEAAHAVDAYLGELWAALQALPQYRGRTTLLVTTDHGRGRGRLWPMHGRKFRASAHTWMAMLGPGIPPTGEVRTPGQYYQTRLVGLIAQCLHLNYPKAPVPTLPTPAVSTDVATTPAEPGAGQ